MDDVAREMRKGLRRLSGAFHARHAAYVLGRQSPDGGWPGRQGGADLYYTSFALRALDLLGHHDAEVWRSAAGLVASRAHRETDLVEFAALLECQALLAMTAQPAQPALNPLLQARIEGFRVDGGYVRAPGEDVSTYCTFLAARCLERLGAAVPDRAAVARRILARQQADGGFSESGTDGPSGVNPTSAALVFLGRGDALAEQVARRAVSFLKRSQHLGGGFLASDGAPCPDLLSTYTALVALLRLGALREIDAAAAARFVRQLASPQGGFRGAPSDDSTDVEYTCYGLGVVGLLSALAGASSARAACPCQNVRLAVR